MRFLEKSFEKDKSGFVRLIGEDSEDIWNIYNLIVPTDCVETATYRRIQTETASGRMDSDRVKMTLCIEVESVTVDLTTCAIHLKGKNKTESKYIKLGSYHTLDISVNQPVKISKSSWDFVVLQHFYAISNVKEKAEVGAVLIQEGLANICLLTESSTLLLQRVQVNIPKKRRGYSLNFNSKTIEKFYQMVCDAVLKELDFDRLKVILIAGPGFANQAVYSHLMKIATTTKSGDNLDHTEELHSPGSIRKNKSKIVLVHASSAHIQTLQEVLRNPLVIPKISATKFANEAKLLDEFYSTLKTDSSRAFYGYEHVNSAAKINAVSNLLVNDKLFRSIDLNERKKYIELVEHVKNSGGKIFIFSSAHQTGEQLENLCGIAAILKFPCPELEDEDFCV